MAREARLLSEALVSHGESRMRSDVETIFQLLDRYAEMLDAILDSGLVRVVDNSEGKASTPKKARVELDEW